MIDLTPDELKIVQTVMRHHVPGREVRVHGSRARGNAKPFSDLDLIIMGTERLPFEILTAMAEDFTESDLKFKVDISVWATLSESFRNAIKDGLMPLPDDGAKS